MTKQQQRRGRPKGSSRLNEKDRLTLDQIADKLVAGEAETCTEAARSLGHNDESGRHRLRRKFRADEAKLMADARERQKPRPVRTRNVSAAETMLSTLDRSALGKLRQSVKNSPLEQLCRSVANSPVQQIQRRLERDTELFRAMERIALPFGGLDPAPFERIARQFAEFQERIDKLTRF